MQPEEYIGIKQYMCMKMNGKGEHEFEKGASKVKLMFKEGKGEMILFASKRKGII